MLLENFSIKFDKDDKILLNENDKSMSNDDKLCQMFLASSLISTYEDISKVTDITDHVFAAINIFKDHQSINNIRAKNVKSVFYYTDEQNRNPKVH